MQTVSRYVRLADRKMHQSEPSPVSGGQITANEEPVVSAGYVRLSDRNCLIVREP